MESKPFLKNIPIIPILFIKKTLENNYSSKDISIKLKDFSNRNNYNLIEVNYFFIKEILKHKIFFNLKEEIREPLLFEAIHWASVNETRSKIRPKSYKDIKEGKHNAFFTQLQKEMIKCIYNSYEITSPNFDIILEKYLSFFFDLSCIKRNRKCKEEDDL